MSGLRRGTLYGVAAYLLWGLLPLYWPPLEPGGAVEVLSHRIVWSPAIVIALLAITSRLARLRAATRSRRHLPTLTAASLVIAINWGTYIYGVTNGHVLEVSLGCCSSVRVSSPPCHCSC